MSTQYENSGDVPVEVICERLEELSNAVTKGDKGSHQFTMRIPAEVDRDADIVLDEAARRLKQIPQWRPIEEAPKDGSVFLTYTPPADWMSGPEDCFDFGQWLEQFGSFAKERCNWKDVTHWKPLDTPEHA